MTVHTAGVLSLTATDFKITHLGVELGLKCIDWGSGIPVISIVEKKGTIYESNIIHEFGGDQSTPEVETKAAGGTVNWIKTVLLPKINVFLKKRFPAATTPTPTFPPGSLADIDSQFSKVLAWAPKSDGTLSVVVK